jgi:hypothetical protein
LLLEGVPCQQEPPNACEFLLRVSDSESDGFPATEREDTQRGKANSECKLTPELANATVGNAAP